MKTTAVALLVTMVLAPAVAAAQQRWVLTAEAATGQPFFLMLEGLNRDQCLQVIQWLAANGGAFTEYTASAVKASVPFGSMTCDEAVTKTRGLRPTQYPQTKSSGDHGWWLAGAMVASTHEDGITRYLAVGPFASQAQCSTVLQWMGHNGKRAFLASGGITGGSTLSMGVVAVQSLSCSNR